MKNYQLLLDDVLSTLQKNSRPTLLLHACCGPCSSYVLEYLAQYFQITVFYYNPNIYPAEEYFRRLDELKSLYDRFPPALENAVRVVEADYIPQDFYDGIGIKNEPALAQEPEKGERCRRCYLLRLKKSFDYAAAHGFDYFCTTLSISPFKDAAKINEIGAALEAELAGHRPAGESCTVAESGFASESAASPAPFGAPQVRSPKWLFSDFKKRGGFKRSLELSAEYDLYRQNYCGCVYSMKNSTAN